MGMFRLGTRIILWFLVVVTGLTRHIIQHDRNPGRGTCFSEHSLPGRQALKCRNVAMSWCLRWTSCCVVVGDILGSILTTAQVLNSFERHSLDYWGPQEASLPEASLVSCCFSLGFLSKWPLIAVSITSFFPALLLQQIHYLGLAYNRCHLHISEHWILKTWQNIIRLSSNYLELACCIFLHLLDRVDFIVVIVVIAASLLTCFGSECMHSLIASITYYWHYHAYQPMV